MVEFARIPSLAQTFDSLRYDSFPLFSTLLLHGWISIGWGNSDLGLRAFGLLVGVLLLGSLWLACRLLRSRVPLISIALVGLNPWVVGAASALRPYGLGMALIVATLGSVWKAAESQKPKWLVIAAALAVLSVQCMYQNAVLLLAICFAGAAVALRASGMRKALGIAGIGLLAALSLLPYRPSIAQAQQWNIVNQRPASMGSLLNVLQQALGAGNPTVVWIWGGLAVLTLWLGIRALLSRKGQRAPSATGSLALFCSVALAAAAAVYMAALKAAQLRTQPWYYAPLAVMIAPALDATIGASATDTKRRMARLGLVLAIAFTIAGSSWAKLFERRTNMDLVASTVRQRAAAGDVVVVNPFYFGVSFQRYYKGSVLWMTIPPLEDVHIHRYDLLKAAMARSDPLDPVLKAMEGALRSGHRVWAVGGLSPTEPGKPVEIPPAPHPKSGWYCGPYEFAWSRQAGRLAETHCLASENVQVAAPGSVSLDETVTITILSGWH